MSIRDLARQRLTKSSAAPLFHVSSPRRETVKQDVSSVSAHETALKQPPDVELEERAAISEFDGGLSRPHAEALASIQAIQPPHGVSSKQMAEIIDLAARRLDRLRNDAGRAA
jgi:hypothetical protein